MAHLRRGLGTVLVCWIAFTAGSRAVAADLPSDLKYLETLAGDENALVDAARRFQLQQFKLMDWDQRLVEEYQASQQYSLAETQRAEMERRAKLIRSAWEWVLERYPNNARANNYFGEYLYDYAGDEAGGVQRWTTAVALDPKLGAAQNNLGIYYFHTGDYARGLDGLQKAIKLEPDNPDYLFNLAQMYLIHFVQIEKITKMTRDKIYKEAIEMSGKAAELSPQDFDIVQDYAVNFFAAESMGAQADWKAAAAAWVKAQGLARTEDERFYSLLNEARARLNGGDHESAVAPLEQALSIKKDSEVAAQLLAKARQKS